MNLNPFRRSKPQSAEVVVDAATGAALRPPIPVAMPDHAEALRSYSEAVKYMRDFQDGLKRTYDASLTDNYSADFRPTWGSANSEMVTAKYKVRARNRTLAKDTPHGKAIIRTFQNNVVGDEPFKLEMRVGDYDGDGEFTEEKELNRVIEHAWKKFCKKENFTVRKTMSAMESWRVVEASLVRDGSVICRHHDDYPFNEFNYAVDFLEEDRLQETFMGRSPVNGKFGGGNPIRFSVEYDKVYQFPLAYWILTRHPGDVLNPSGYLGDRNQNIDCWREQVPAKDIIYFNNLRDRAEQDIGMTELDSTTMPLWRIHQYEKALTLSSIASASKPWWLEQEVPTGLAAPSDPATIYANGPTYNGPQGPLVGGGGTVDPAVSQQGLPGPQNNIRPAARESLPPGYKLKQGDPRFPIEAAHEFRLDNTRDIAIGSGVSYQNASGDYQNLGFIAGLMCQIPFQDNCRVRQKNMIDGGVDAVFRRWVRSAIMCGYFEKRGTNVPIARLDEICEAAHFKGRGWSFVNPLVQAQSLILLNKEGHMTRQQVQNELPTGMSVEKLFQEFSNENAEMDANDLKFGDAALADQEAPTTDDTEEGGSADIPPKKKKQVPRTA